MVKLNQSANLNQLISRLQPADLSRLIWQPYLLPQEEEPKPQIEDGSKTQVLNQIQNIQQESPTNNNNAATKVKEITKVSFSKVILFQSGQSFV